MSRREIVSVASIALIALSGCTTRAQTSAVARSTASDVRPSTVPTDLVGTWQGSFGPLAADAGGGGATGSMTLAIHDDGTYTATERRGATTQTFSGIVVANGRSITLRNSSGRWLSLVHRGDALYGTMPDPRSGYTLQFSVVKESGASASPASAPSAGQ